MAPRLNEHPHAAESADFEDEFFEGSPSATSRKSKTKILLLKILARWYWIALFLILGILASTYYLSKAPEQFSSTATLEVKPQSTTIMRQDVADEIDVRSLEGLNTAVVRIGRFELLERVASRVDVRALPGLMPPTVDWRPEWLINWLEGEKKESTPSDSKSTQNPPPPPAALAGFIGSRMDVSVRRGTRLVDITFTHEVPEVAKALADAVAREYIAELAGAVSEGRTTQSDTLIKESEEARNKLQAAESALANYRRALELHKSLEAEENNVAQLSRRYLPKHPRMIAASGELDALKGRFLDEFQITINSPADKSYWETSASQIDATNEDPEARLRLARQLLLARTNILQGEVASQMSVFNAMLTRIEESNVNRQGNDSQIEVSSLARVPGLPSSPDRTKVLTTGGAAGAGLGLAIVFLLIRIDNKYHSVAQLEEETSFPVLAAISDIDPRHLDQAAQKYFKEHPEVQSHPLMDDWDPHLIFRPGTSTTTFAEMFRVLRASVTLLGDETKRKITLFSSALPGEGKSTVSANFALAAAGQGRKTLLIDLDLRKPNIHRVFGRPRSEQGLGITEWLAGKATFDEVISSENGCDHLDVIFSGKQAPNPGELLSIPRLKELFAESRKRYDVVVIDSAPLLAVPDTRIITPIVDNFCLVVRADYVPRGAVLRALDLQESNHSAPVGFVLNGFKETRLMMGYNYSYGSYRYSSYGRVAQYGYGSYGSYGAYGSDDTDLDEKTRKQRRKANRKRNAHRRRSKIS